jgi:hypothetical protein
VIWTPKVINMDVGTVSAANIVSHFVAGMTQRTFLNGARPSKKTRAKSCTMLKSRSADHYIYILTITISYDAQGKLIPEFLYENASMSELNACWMQQHWRTEPVTGTPAVKTQD